MIYESSYGIVPLRQNAIGQWEVFMVQLWAGHWGLPKGHSESGEDSHAAATRELFEETGLTITHFLDASPLVESYHFFRKGTTVTKNVTYFLAEVTGDVNLQKEEIRDGRWVPLEQAEDLATFPATKAVCRSAHERVDDE